MKTNIFSFFAIVVLFFTGCVDEGPIGPVGPPGRDGNANVYYSEWISPKAWAGQTGDWYFKILDDAITEDVVEGGVILAYMSIPVDVYPTAVRQMPANIDGVNWGVLIPDYGELEFTSDGVNQPGTKDYYFRFVIIPSNIQLKSGAFKGSGLNLEELKQMSYAKVCEKFGIPE